MKISNIFLTQILCHDEIAGTGFFIDSKTVLTAMHTITSDIEDLQLKEEKAVELYINESEVIQAKSLNLVDAIDNRVDCVLLGIEEVFEEGEKVRLKAPANTLQDYECKVFGYPKELGTLIELDGQIIKWEEINSDSYDMIVKIKKQDKLQNYEGISGGPIMIGGNVIGFAVKQLSDNKIAGISLKCLKEFLPEVYSNKIVVSNIRKTAILHTSSLVERCNLDFFENHLKQVLNIAGPRYVSELNVENETFVTVNKILDKESIEKEILEAERKWSELYKKLCNSIGNIRDTKHNFLKKSAEDIERITGKLQTKWSSFRNRDLDMDLFRTQLELAEKELEVIFEKEFQRFEEEYGKGNYRNRSWKGFMASYMCTFPTYHLEELEDSIELCKVLIKQINKESMYLYQKKTVLLTGRGGMGKTHLLCDITKQWISNQIPAFLFFGEQFGMNNASEEILKRLGLEQISFEEFLSFFDELAEEKQCYVPICVDALNETIKNDYWNSQLLSLSAAVENYRNIKLIVSCRSIYLQEVLDEDIVSRMAIVEQKGFEHVEIEAMRQFGEYYGIHLNFDYLLHQEYRNPLYLKMLCEVAQTQENFHAEAGDLMKLMKDFFVMKDKKISKEISISVREHIVQQILGMVANSMIKQNKNYILWSELRTIVKKLLSEYSCEGDTQNLLRKLLSENLFKEADNDNERIVFGYERFYEIIIAQSVLGATENETIQRIYKIQEKQQMTIGTLELIQILFMRQFQHEILEYIIPEEWDIRWIESFGQSLYWRTNQEVTSETKKFVKYFLKNNKEEKVRTILLAILGVSTKVDFDLNAEYLHTFLIKQPPLWRDYYLSFFLLGNFEKEKIIYDICIRSQKLANYEVTEKGAQLWAITLSWLCSLNDIKIRDNASKGLANLFRKNTNIIIAVLNKFKDLEEDYIHERIWQAAYSALLLAGEEVVLKEVVEYIDIQFAKKGAWPENVLIRDYLYKIIEYSVNRRGFPDSMLITYQPPYKSEKLTKVSEETLQKWKKENGRLYFNCIESDFAIYTIPSEVEDYGFSKKEIGGIIMQNILNSGYDDNLEKYDQMIDYKYGSLRSRDSSVERIGKKYQKIFLYRCMGRLYDNYEYKSRYSYAEGNYPLIGEQGTSFREIDLTALPYEAEKDAFRAKQIYYPFSRYRDFSDEKWFHKKDVTQYFESLFLQKYNSDKYMILQGYFHDREKNSPKYREVWVQIRSYFFGKKYKQNFLDWLKGKDFEGRWMPEGTNHLYEVSIGEYPWSEYITQYLREMQEEQSFRGNSPAPCHIIPTVNDYNNEKDSEFCPSSIAGKFMFPCKDLFEVLDLKWDGKNGFCAKEKPVVYLSEGADSALYIDKDLLIDYLERSGQEIVWTVLGEKQKIGGMGFRDFPGRSEFSYSYYWDNGQIKRNHEVFHVRKAQYDG